MIRKLIVSLLVLIPLHPLFSMERESIRPQEAVQQANPEQLAALLQILAQEQEQPQADVCVVCQQGLNDGPQATLSCRHTFHKFCLEAFYKSQLLANEATPLFCPVCRYPLADDDGVDLDLAFSLDDLLNAQWTLLWRLVGAVGDERVREIYTAALESPHFIESLKEFTTASDDQLLALQENLRTLPISTQSISDGTLLAKLQELCNGATKDQLIEAISALTIHFQLTPEHLKDLTENHLTRGQGAIILPYINPTLIFLRWIMEHRGLEMPDLEDNPLAHIAADIKLPELLSFMLTKTFKAMALLANSNQETLETTPFMVLYPALVSARTLGLYLQNPQAFEALLRSTVHNVFPLPVDEPIFRDLGEAFASLLLHRENLTIESVERILRTNTRLFEHLDGFSAREIALMQQLLREPRIEEERDSASEAEGQPRVPAAKLGGSSQVPDLNAQPQLKVTNASAQNPAIPSVEQNNQQASNDIPYVAAGNLAAFRQLLAHYANRQTLDALKQSGKEVLLYAKGFNRNNWRPRLVELGERRVPAKLILASFLSGVFWTLFIHYVFFAQPSCATNPGASFVNESAMCFTSDKTNESLMGFKK